MKEIMRLEVFRGLIMMFSELPSVNTGGAGRLWEVSTQNFQQARQFFPPAASAHTSLMSLPSRPLNRCTQALNSPEVTAFQFLNQIVFLRAASLLTVSKCQRTRSSWHLAGFATTLLWRSRLPLHQRLSIDHRREAHWLPPAQAYLGEKKK